MVSKTMTTVCVPLGEHTVELWKGVLVGVAAKTKEVLVKVPPSGSPWKGGKAGLVTI